VNDPSARRTVEILLVEDNPGDVRLVHEALRSVDAPWRITVARDGDEALDLLTGRARKDGGYRPDLILLDLNLPRRDGRELLGSIKADPALKRIPVVVMTSSSAQQDILNAYDLQVNSYIVKDIGLDKFIDAIRAVGRFWLNLATLPPRG